MQQSQQAERFFKYHLLNFHLGEIIYWINAKLSTQRFPRNISWSNSGRFDFDMFFFFSGFRKIMYPLLYKNKFSTKDFFSECDQILSFLQIWSHLLKKSLMENFVFSAVHTLISQSTLQEITGCCQWTSNLSKTL